MGLVRYYLNSGWLPMALFLAMARLSIVIEEHPAVAGSASRALDGYLISTILLSGLLASMGLAGVVQLVRRAWFKGGLNLFFFMIGGIPWWLKLGG